MCTVLYCTQYDDTTKGLRYLVYGTKYNEDSTYGIGISLESIDVKRSDQWCPKDVSARYV